MTVAELLVAILVVGGIATIGIVVIAVNSINSPKAKDAQSEEG